jgi:selenocysteine lyase/cysteine desulfurase
VVTTALEHNSVVRPLAALREASVIEVTTVGCGRDGIIDPDEIRRVIGPRTRLVAITHCSNVIGTIQPIAEIGAIAHAAGARFLVDAAQSVGLVGLDVGHLEIDLLAAPGHKALLGPSGTGFLYVRRGLTLAPLRRGGTGTRSEDQNQPAEMPWRLESGTPNVHGLAGLAASTLYIDEVSPARLLEHERALAARFMEGARELRHTRLYGSPDFERRVGIVCLGIENQDVTELAVLLDQEFGICARAGLHCAPGAHTVLGTAPGGALRVSFGWANTHEDVDAVLASLRVIT